MGIPTLHVLFVDHHIGRSVAPHARCSIARTHPATIAAMVIGAVAKARSKLVHFGFD